MKGNVITNKQIAFCGQIILGVTGLSTIKKVSFLYGIWEPLLYYLLIAKIQEAAPHVEISLNQNPMAHGSKNCILYIFTESFFLFCI